MAFVDQPIECSAPPSSVDIGADLENAEDSAERTQGEALEVATLNRRDGRLRQLGRGGQVELAPAAAAAEGPDHQADASIVHGPDDRDRALSEPYPRRTDPQPGGGSTDRRSMRDTVQEPARPIIESDSQRDVQED
jgi:hypothetical protein